MLASAAGAALLAGCSGGSDPAVRNSGPTAEDRARARAARDSEALAERYAAVVAAHPPLAARLEPLRAEVVQHAQAFGSGTSGSHPSSSASPSGSPSVSPGVSAGASPVPADPKSALAGLAAAERALSDQRAKALLDLPGELARLMASVAAAGAAHGYLLTEGGT
ncbi:hypothetical protein ABZ845_28325 [Streptomyces sp. NPDC047022]|uniref:hypothetical protein n=1 Tax=Streptomyces sp. NPDC047022 TaxID=3155737 RepID=UPI0033DE9DE2